MFAAYVLVTVITIVVNAGAAIADFLRVKVVLANGAALGIPSSLLTPLGLLKVAGAAGLLIGLLGVHVLGIMAAIGLVLFFTGAIAVHIRARVFRNLVYPGVFWLLAIASLVLAIGQLQ